LGEDHPGSMGVRSRTRLQNTLQSAALSAIPTKSLNSLSSRGSSHAAGDSEYMLEKHAIEETTPRGRGFLSTIFLVKPSPLLQMTAEPIKPVCMFQPMKVIQPGG